MSPLEPRHVRGACAQVGRTVAVLDRDRALITCQCCGMGSHHPQDIAQGYCAWCASFHQHVESPHEEQA
jgi:hypothetical protein